MLALALSVAGVAAGCGGAAPSEPVLVDGSSTVFPLSEAIALDYLRRHSSAQVTVTFSGTDSGFDKFCRGGLDIVDASRPITAPEQDLCAANRVDFVELPVARDAITVIVNARNTWAASMTVAELRTLWSPEADRKMTKWSQVRKGWPDRRDRALRPGRRVGHLRLLHGRDQRRRAGQPQGLHGERRRLDHRRGVATDEFALGYVGYGYFDRATERAEERRHRRSRRQHRPGAIEPSPQNVGRGVYRPLSRILFIYVNHARVERPDVRALVDDYLRHAGERAAQVGTIALMSNVYDLAHQRFTKQRTGTMYGSPSAAELGIEYLLTQ